MPTTPTADEAVTRAQRVLKDRIGTIRQAVEARQHVADVREESDRERAELEASIRDRASEAERVDLKAYNAAVNAGWSVNELRKIGLPEPAKQARRRRRVAERASDSTSSNPVKTP